MNRWMLSILFSATLLVAQQKDQKPPEPPEEDESFKTKEYEFNPLQAAKELKIGLYYMKKGSFKAAAGRFDEASRWDPANAEVFLRLGEAREKLKDAAAAKEAYAKFLELAPDSKAAPAVRKKIGTRK